MVLMSTGSGGGRGGLTGEFIKAVLSAGMGPGRKIHSLCRSTFNTLRKCIHLDVTSRQQTNEVARMTVYILCIFRLLEQLDHFFPTVKEIVKWAVLPGG